MLVSTFWSTVAQREAISSAKQETEPLEKSQSSSKPSWKMMWLAALVQVATICSQQQEREGWAVKCAREQVQNPALDDLISLTGFTRDKLARRCVWKTMLASNQE
jgi:hypothetical protein